MAVISNIQGYSIHDGPGIRTVVFFKGCPLTCKWCVNPENIKPKIEIGFIANLCQGCGRCFQACPNGAINSDPEKPRLDYEKCVTCGKCVEACYYNAMVRYGEEMSVDEVFDKVRRDKMFYDGSGGGVTVSGGEPLLFAEFVKNLFDLCKKDGITTCIETSGFVSEEKCSLVLPVTDYFLYDLKLIDNESHEEYTGSSNEQILSNAAFLVNNKANILFRMPLIPDVNDGNDSILKTAGFVKSIDNPKIQLMPFHRIGDSKYKALGEKYAFGNVEAMEKERVEEVMKAFIEAGVECSISK